MHRRDILRSLFFGAATAKVLMTEATPVAIEKVPEQGPDTAGMFNSKWHNMPDMPWTGEDVWAQRLQDFCIKEGELQCLVHGRDRTVHILTHQLSADSKSFTATIDFRFLNKQGFRDAENFAGFRLGLKGRFNDYRSAIMTGKGIDVGVTRNGFLFIDKIISDKKIDEKVLNRNIKLVFVAIPQSSGGCFAKLKALDIAGNTIATLSSSENCHNDWAGNIAIVSHFNAINENTNQPTMAVSHVKLEGEKLMHDPHQTYGAIYFAQYTVQSTVLKLTAQLAPVDIAGAEAIMLIKKEDSWKKMAFSKIHPLARIANFRVENWDATESIPYKIVYSHPLKNGQKKEYSYEGTIAAEPLQKEKVKALAFSCNWDFGFPDNEIVKNASAHNADMAFFLGDQFYESNGGFGIQMNPLDKASLDYLRKWIMFGWSYRNLFQHIPMVALPDDHDVYHGNVWGSGGRATITTGGAAAQQDSGGYKMPAEWVNMAQLTQTSHMPDPYDPAPVAQSIGVYYTSWEYGGISFGIIEDRKFKSAPKDILPDEAKVFNGYAENPSFDKSKVKLLEAQLLGERQLDFLSHWNNQWNKTTHFKVLVSASPFCCLQTLPEGTKNDQGTPDLPIPAKGEYVNGDLPTQDMDSNGWPQNRRNEVLKLLRKNFTLHLAGDQHLPSVVQYGVDAFGDSGFCFAVPALSNLWPRRWWPPVNAVHQPLPGKPRYTGNFVDGFENKITVHAVANPYQSGRQPAPLYDRVTGYGVVEFDKINDEITMHCYPRYANETGNQKQYDGWPVTIKRSDNFGKSGMKECPAILLDENKNYLVQVINEETNELLYQQNICRNHFIPFVEKEGSHTMLITERESGKKRKYDV